MDDRKRHIKKYAFSNENALMWKGLKITGQLTCENINYRERFPKFPQITPFKTNKLKNEKCNNETVRKEQPVTAVASLVADKTVFRQVL